MRHGLRLTVDGYRGYLGNEKTEVKLHYNDYIGNHFYPKATVFDRLYNYVDYAKHFESWYYDWYEDFKQDNMVYGLHQQDIQQVPIYGDYIPEDQSQQQASIPRTLETSTALTQEESDNLTHVSPYRDWCKECVQGKRRQQINVEAIEAITRFIVENGLQTPILQSDGEPAILELLNELGRQLPHVKN
eukprot:2324161-Amphidinium_carterae.1